MQTIKQAFPSRRISAVALAVCGVVIDSISSTMESYTVSSADIPDVDVVTVCVQPQGALTAACCGVLIGDDPLSLDHAKLLAGGGRGQGIHVGRVQVAGGHLREKGKDDIV